MSPGLFQDFMDGYIKQSVVVMTASSQSRRSQIELGSQILVFVLLNLWDPSSGLRLVQLLLEWNTYLLFNSDIVNFVWKIGGGRDVCLVI